MPPARAVGRSLELVDNGPTRTAPSPQAQVFASTAPPPAAAEPEPAAVPVSPPAAAVPVSPPAMGRDQAVLVEVRKRHAELMERRALRRADAAEAALREGAARLDQLELELAEARREDERMRAELALVERERREAAQLAHSEGAVRLELERENADRLRRDEAAAGAVLELLEVVQNHARTLRREVEALRRASEAVATPPPPDLRGEQQQSARARPEAARPGTGSAHPDPPPRENGAVAPDRLAAALSRLREESPRPEPARERGGAVEPERVNGRVELAPTPELPPDPPPRPSPGSPLDPAGPRDRTAPWLAPALERLLREDPALVGSLVIHLLPAQRLVAGPVRYDLVLRDAGCLAVTVCDHEVRVDLRDEPRPVTESWFRVFAARRTPEGAKRPRIEGDLAGLGRLLLYGPVRRRLSRRVAAVRGGRRALEALAALVTAPLSLRELDAAGVRLDPGLTLHLVAGMIDPSWTQGERFTVGHESRGADGRAYLLVRDGARAGVSRRAPLGPVATTIRCPDEQLLTLLAGGSASEATVLGAAGPVALLREWIARAERG